MSFQPIAVTTTGDDKQILESIGQELLASNLAACVQIGGPVDSWYRWNGNIEQSREWQCLIKTGTQHFDAVRDTIMRLHNYDLPQIVSFEISDGSAGYLAWLETNTK